MPLVIAIMAMTLLTALGTVLVLGTMTETAIAASYRQSTEAFYAAEAAGEFVVGDLAAASDWEDILNGSTMSSFVDGPPDGPRRVGAATLDLTEATGEINAIAAASAGSNSQSYRLYAYGRFADLVASTAVQSPMYVVVWVAELSGEQPAEEPAPVLGVVGRAYGPTGSSRSVAVSVTRTGTSEAGVPTLIRMLSWAEWR